MKTRFLILLLALNLSHAAWAQNGLDDAFVETSEMGTTDWVEGYVEARGHGTSRYLGNKVQEELMAKQAARTMAQARLLELVKGIRVTGLSTLNVHAQSDTRAATRIKGTLRGARSVKETATWQKDASSRRGEVVMAEVTLRVCVSPTCKETENNLTQATFNPTQNKAVTTTQLKDHSLPSAVIIDLQQALFLPALSPEIVSEDKAIIYSQDTVDPEAILEKGLIHYSKSIAEAKKLSISGSNPIVLSALRVSKDNQIVLSHKDAETFATIPAVKSGHLIVALD